MEKCRSLNQAPRRLDFSGKTSGRPILRVAESFKLLNPSELPQTPLPSRTRLKKTIARGKWHTVQTPAQISCPHGSLLPGAWQSNVQKSDVLGRFEGFDFCRNFFYNWQVQRGAASTSSNPQHTVTSREGDGGGCFSFFTCVLEIPGHCCRV